MWNSILNGRNSRYLDLDTRYFVCRTRLIAIGQIFESQCVIVNSNFESSVLFFDSNLSSRVPSAECRVPNVGCRVSVIGSQYSVIESYSFHRLPTPGFRVSVLGDSRRQSWISGMRDLPYSNRTNVWKSVCNCQYLFHHVQTLDVNILNWMTRTTLLPLASIWLGRRCTSQSLPSFHGCQLVDLQSLSGGVPSSTSVPSALHPSLHPPAREQQDVGPQRQTRKD